MSRCRAREAVVDGSFPTDERCVRESGHEPPHHCPHGFHWTDDRGRFEGKCGHCNSHVVLKPAEPTGGAV